MEKFQESFEKAKHYLKIADHMLSTTFPLIKDYNLIPLVVENIFLALTNALAALLHYELLFKRVPLFNETFDSKFKVFNSYCVRRYNFDKEILDVMLSVKNIVLRHRKSPVEFSRKDKFVICSDSYETLTVRLDDVKNYLHKTKIFIQEVHNIISRDERIFRRSKAGT